MRILQKSRVFLCKSQQSRKASKTSNMILDQVYRTQTMLNKKRRIRRHGLSSPSGIQFFRPVPATCIARRLALVKSPKSCEGGPKKKKKKKTSRFKSLKVRAWPGRLRQKLRGNSAAQPAKIDGQKSSV